MDCLNIESIIECEKQEVWDITMTGDEDFYDGEPNFIAQNILVHNCHAAGVVISPIPLSTVCPLHATKGVSGDDTDKVMATQFSMKDVESLGLIKMDILGLSTKTTVATAVEMIKEITGDIIDVDNIPLDDSETLSLLNSGKTDGCFQLENTGMKQTLRQIRVDSFDDLVTSIAMYRPGPKDYIPSLAKRKRGSETVTYHHPITKKITERTYGILVYQEQIMQVFMALADMTATDGYIFMRGCAKKKTKLIDGYKVKFTNGALAKGVSSSVINKVWADMKKFASYAFNRCLSFSTEVINPVNLEKLQLGQLLDQENKGKGFIVESKAINKEGNLQTVYDEIVEVFETGEKDIYNIQLDNGMKIECTLDHKFLCSDKKFHTIIEILKGDLDILYED